MDWIIPGEAGIYVSYLEPFKPAANIMWVAGGAAIGFGIYNIVHGNEKGGIAQVILGTIAVLGSFFVN